jgi:hypothetical protein
MRALARTAKQVRAGAAARPAPFAEETGTAPEYIDLRFAMKDPP